MDEQEEWDDDWDDIGRLVSWQIKNGQHHNRNWPPPAGVLPPSLEA